VLRRVDNHSHVREAAGGMAIEQSDDRVRQPQPTRLTCTAARLGGWLNRALGTTPRPPILALTLCVVIVRFAGPAPAEARAPHERPCPNRGVNLSVEHMSCRYGAALTQAFYGHDHFPCRPHGPIGGLERCRFRFVFRNRTWRGTYRVEPGDGSVLDYVLRRNGRLARRYEFG
jgi:hypothetical protein